MPVLGWEGRKGGCNTVPRPHLQAHRDNLYPEVSCLSVTWLQFGRLDVSSIKEGGRNPQNLIKCPRETENKTNRTHTHTGLFPTHYCMRRENNVFYKPCKRLGRGTLSPKTMFISVSASQAWAAYPGNEKFPESWLSKAAYTASSVKNSSYAEERPDKATASFILGK